MPREISSPESNSPDQEIVKPVIGLQPLADHLGVSSRTILRWVNAGEFPKPFRIGRRLLRWEVEIVNQWIDDGCPEIPEKELSK